MRNTDENSAEPIVERLSRREQAGTSIQRPPDFITWMMPLITRRSSTRATPRNLFGSNGPSRSNCSSLNQNSLKSRHLLLQRLNHITAEKEIMFIDPDPRSRPSTGRPSNFVYHHTNNASTAQAATSGRSRRAYPGPPGSLGEGQRYDGGWPDSLAAPSQLYFHQRSRL